MLPRSFLSASSLTNDQKEIPKAPTTPIHASTKRRRFSDAEIGADEDTGSDSSSESDGDMSNLYENYSLVYLQNDIGTLQSQIQHQQTRQKKHMRKVQLLDKNIRMNTKKLGRLTRLLMTQQQQQQQHHQHQQPELTPASPLHLSNKQLAIKPNSISTADDRDAPLFQSAPSLSSSSSSSTSKKIKTESSSAKTTQLLPTNRSRIATPSTSSSNSHVLPPSTSADINLASQDTLDIIVRKNVTTTKSGFDRKVRMLLCYNENTTNEHMKDLVVSSSLDGELQFWNACDRKRIDKLGCDALYKDHWVEDLCWASPTALTAIPAPKDGMNTQSVVVLDMNSVARNSVKGDIQSMTKLPHGNKGFDVITSADLGNHPTALQEKISFVTAGADKSIYLWNLTRDARNDTFDEELHCLDIPHTNRIQALCTDKYNKTLYSGGSDQKFYAFDMEKGISIYGFTIGSRINSINVNHANRNYALLGLSRTENQFCLYDKRCSGTTGIRLRFGATEDENMSKYGQPDWHCNGHTVVYGSQGGPRLNFWDIRYTGIGKGPSFTITLSDTAASKTNKVMQSVFLPGRNTIATATASRAFIWTDYSISENCKPAPI